LVLSCLSGWPYPLAELLVHYGEHALAFRLPAICYALGEIGSTPHQSARAFLDGCAQSRNWSVRLQAVLAQFKTFVKSEGLYRINHRGQITADYEAVVGRLTVSMSIEQQIACRLAFASLLSGPSLGSFAQPFQAHYAALQSEIEQLCLPFLKDDANKSKAGTLHRLIRTNDYVGVCVLVAIDLDGADGHPLFATLVDSCCIGAIAGAGHDQAQRHVAMCFLLKNEHRIAFEIAEGLASRNPDSIDLQILAVEILGDMPGEEEQAANRVAAIRRGYRLASEDEARLIAIEAGIGNRTRSA
jgi:hypothetical protein